MKTYSDDLIKNSVELRYINSLALSYCPVEGNVIYSHPLEDKNQPFNFEFYPKRYNLWVLAQQSSEVMEIGFCAGHSALIMFLANPKIKLTVFDLAFHAYTRPCYEYIKIRFITSQIYSGDSRKGVPVFIRDYPGHKFDLIHIDGSHDENYFKVDYFNSKIVSKPGTLIIFDDSGLDPDTPINKLIREKVSAKEIEIVDRHQMGLLETPHHEIVRVL